MRNRWVLWLFGWLRTLWEWLRGLISPRAPEPLAVAHEGGPWEVWAAIPGLPPGPLVRTPEGGAAGMSYARAVAAARNEMALAGVAGDPREGTELWVVADGVEYPCHRWVYTDGAWGPDRAHEHPSNPGEVSHA